MERHIFEHEKVRFRRNEIATLDLFPSAACGIPVFLRRPRRIWRWIGGSLLAIAVLICVFAVAIQTIGESVIGSERLRLHAERAIANLIGTDVGITIGDVRLGFGTSSLFALEIRDAHVERKGDGAPLADAQRLLFGVKALPLLEGRIELSQVEAADAQVSAGLMPVLGGLGGAPFGPREASNAIFDGVQRLFAMTDALREVSLTDVRFTTGGQGGLQDVVIEQMEMRRQGEHDITLEGAAYHGNRYLFLEGAATRNPQKGTIQALSVELTAPVSGAVEENGARGALQSMGDFELSLAAHQSEKTDDGPAIVLEAKFQDILLGVDRSELLVDRADARIGFSESAETFSFLASPIDVGQSVINLQGSIAPDDGEEPGYRFNLVSRDSVMEPEESPESALPFAMRASGRYEMNARRLNAEKINIRTSGGSMMASAAVTLPPGLAPGLSVAIYMDELPTAHAKQFWPWFAASGARNWTLRHVFGGHVRESNLRLSVPPGRLGNGVPLDREELGGRFNLVDTRFDIAGNMPPVRDGVGSVVFEGTDVKVDLSEGTIYMPSGRQVDVSTGSLTINAAHLKPRIGALAIDVAGDASAIAELASYRPISASRFYDFGPADLSGPTSGHIAADIPLQDGIPMADLDWHVRLAFDDLSLSKPIEGQMLTRAAGTLNIQPDRAGFTADAELNGIPAKLHLVQPFANSAVARERHIELQMDNASRDKLFPGLGQLVSGPFTVTYEEQSDERKKVTVGLERARLMLPWIGWEKPPGTPATADFFMQQDGNTTELSEFSLSGENLSASGTVRLAGDRLEDARFERVRLSPGDDLSVVVDGTGGGYAVSVRGASLDARTVIKYALGADAQTDQGDPGDGSDVRLDAKLDRVAGFNGQVLEQLELTASFGKDTTQISGKAATPRYGSVTFARNETGGQASVRASSSNAGAVLGFLDLYKHMEGGRLSTALSGAENALSGKVDIRDFWIVDEPQLDFLVAASTDRNRRVERVDTSRVYFDTGAATIMKRRGELGIAEGVLRGPSMGSTFQGTLYDANDNTAITGTFMPLYGLNRMFGEIPLIGQILGNGRDQGLIGITYRLSGKFSDPVLNVNPISVIAPGIFRQIFQYQ